MKGLKKMANLYLLTQNQNRGYNTYDRLVVCADTPELAALVLPYSTMEWGNRYSSWCSSPRHVTVTLLGTAAMNIEKDSLVLSSFNAG